MSGIPGAFSRERRPGRQTESPPAGPTPTRSPPPPPAGRLPGTPGAFSRERRPGRQTESPPAVPTQTRSSRTPRACRSASTPPSPPPSAPGRRGPPPRPPDGDPAGRPHPDALIANPARLPQRQHLAVHSVFRAEAADAPPADLVERGVAADEQGAVAGGEHGLRRNGE